MGLGRSLAVALVGLNGYLVEVEAHVAAGLPQFTLVGLPDTSLAESRERVRAASANTGCPLPSRRITVNLSPAALPKTGTSFDLAVAAALLAATDAVPAEAVAVRVHLGELGLDGRVRPVRGVLPSVMAAVQAGFGDVVVPWANRGEAALVPGARVTPVRHLADVIALHRGDPFPNEVAGVFDEIVPERDDLETPGAGAATSGDLADVVGQPEARFALEVAAGGGHHLLLVGPPWGRQDHARCPAPRPAARSGRRGRPRGERHPLGRRHPGTGRRGLIRRPPYQDPHHTATVVSLVGGGSGLPRPGAASRAHRGVLFLDEAAEFDPRVLEALRQPLENGTLVIHRALGTAQFPARFQLVLAANPCPCGQGSGKGKECTCTPTARRRYLSRLSGPLLDRVDLQVEVVVGVASRHGHPPSGESSAMVAARVAEARAAARERLVGLAWQCNGEVPGSWLRGAWRLAPAVIRDLDVALDRSRLSIRGYDRVLRVAWTIADLAGRTRPDRDDVGRALVLRLRGQVAA